MTSFTVKVSVNNFKVDKSENLDNAFYVFWHDTSKKRKKSRFLDFGKNVTKRILELYLWGVVLRGVYAATPDQVHVQRWTTLP